MNKSIGIENIRLVGTFWFGSVCGFRIGFLVCVDAVSFIAVVHACAY